MTKISIKKIKISPLPLPKKIQKIQKTPLNNYKFAAGEMLSIIGVIFLGEVSSSLGGKTFRAFFFKGRI